MEIKSPMIREIKKERKYSLIDPFWLEVLIDNMRFIDVMFFGIAFSSQMRSRMVVASF